MAITGWKDRVLQSGHLIIKNILIVINFLTLLAGITMISVGAYLQTNQQSAFPDNWSALPGGAIFVGVLVTFISFLGCFGAANEKTVVLKSYFAVVTVMILLQFIIGGVAYSKRSDVPAQLDSNWASFSKANPKWTEAVERTFKCCGYNNLTDATPNLTCGKYVDPTDSTAGPYQFTDPCRTLIIEKFESSFESLGVAGVTLGCIELFGLGCSAFLWVFINHRNAAAYGQLGGV